MAKQYVFDYLPKTRKGKLNWYVSSYCQHTPIHVFRTKAQAIKFASELPVFRYSDGLTIPHTIGWMDRNADPRLQVSNTRKIVDHRNEV
jgi:hypothetical protein